MSRFDYDRKMRIKEAEYRKQRIWDIRKVERGSYGADPKWERENPDLPKYGGTPHNSPETEYRSNPVGTIARHTKWVRS